MRCSSLAACGDDDDGGGGGGTDAPGGHVGDDDRSSGGADTTTGATTIGSGGGGGEGRELIIARDMDLTTLDPPRAYCDTCQIYLTAVYETLIGVDPTDLNDAGAAARRRRGRPTPTTPSSRSRSTPTATFADGSPVTADDVKFSWERLAGLEGSASYLMAGVESVEAPDDRHRRRHVRGAELGVPATSSARRYMGIIEQGARPRPTARRADAERRRRAVVPRQLGRQRAVRARVVHRGRRSSCWPATTATGAPPSAVPGRHAQAGQGRHAQLQQLQQGDVDIAMQISFDSVGQLEGDRGRHDREVDSYNFVYLGLGPGASAARTSQDPNVREAIRMAIDYDGRARHARSAATASCRRRRSRTGSTGSAEGLPLPEQDVEGAKALLDRGRRRRTHAATPPTRPSTSTASTSTR